MDGWEIPQIWSRTQTSATMLGIGRPSASILEFQIAPLYQISAMPVLLQGRLLRRGQLPERDFELRGGKTKCHGDFGVSARSSLMGR